MIHAGDLFDVLPTLPAASIDACVTDPPYGIGFMGREWDTFKPGTGATRKLMHPRERVAAKIVSDNPNIDGRHRSPALSPSQIDYDYSTAGLRGFQQWTERWAAEVFRVLKPGAYIVVCGAPRSHHRMMCGLEDAGFVVRDCFAWLFGSGFPKNKNLGNGRGTALKPANEPIALAWKPFKGTISGNVEKWGTGALNIDACRIQTDETLAIGSGRIHFEGGRGGSSGGQQHDAGRWPANVLLDEAAAAALDEMTGELVSGPESDKGHRRNADRAAMRNTYDGFQGQEVTGVLYGDRGGASRFYKVVNSDDSITSNQSCEKTRGAISESRTAAGIGNGARLEAASSTSNLTSRWIWERENGSIPAGYEIHHRDHDDSNNALENLALVTAAWHDDYHQRLREDHVVIDGVEQRRCQRCRNYRPLDDFADRAAGTKQGYCRRCATASHGDWQQRNREHYNTYMREYRKARRTR